MFFAIDLLDILSLPSLPGIFKVQNMLEEPFSATLDEACKEIRLSCTRKRNKEEENENLEGSCLCPCLVISVDCFPPLQKYMYHRRYQPVHVATASAISSEVKHERTSI